MLEELNVKGFRKYRDFSVFDLANVNIVLGDNNVGKTSFLEAVYVWCCGCNAGSFVNIPLSRGRYGFIQQPFWIMEELLSVVNTPQNVPMKMSFTVTLRKSSTIMDWTLKVSLKLQKNL